MFQLEKPATEALPERQGALPELSDDQAEFIRAWSMWNSTKPRATKMNLVPPQAVYFVQVTLYTLAALLLFFWNFVVWDFSRYAAEARGGLNKPPDELLLYSSFILLFAIIVAHWILTGRKARSERWQRWAWPNYENFRDEEDRLQVLGFLRLIIGVLFILIGVASLLR